MVALCNPRGHKQGAWLSCANNIIDEATMMTTPSNHDIQTTQHQAMCIDGLLDAKRAGGCTHINTEGLKAFPSQLIDKVCVEPVATVDISSRQQEASVCRQGLLPSISTTKMRCRHLQAHATKDRLVCRFLAGWLGSPAVLFCGADIYTCGSTL
jgi:hypothetical protein